MPHMTAQEKLQLAQEELKRADHSIAVSLKYTRTVDVIKSIVQRLINTIGFSLQAYLEVQKEKEEIETVPDLPRMIVEQACQLCADDPMINDFCNFYLLLRKIDKAEFTRAQEYRRHVTMTAELDDGETIQITIDIITDYFERTKEFYLYVHNLVLGKND